MIASHDPASHDPAHLSAKLITALLLTIALLASSGCGVLGGSLRDPPAVRHRSAEYAPQPPEEWKLANGLTVMFKEDHEIPIVSGALVIRGGSLWEAADDTGTISAMGSQMRQGGAGPLSADALDRELEVLSASVGSSFSAESGGTSFSALTSDLDRVFEIFADVTLRPRFQEDRLNLWKGQTIEGIRRRVDDPSTISGIALNQILYEGTPYGRVLLENDVRAINRIGLLRAHRRFVSPDEAILVVSGDITRDTLSRLVQQHFAAWEAKAEPVPPPPPIDTQPKPAIYFIKGPFTQATVYLGHLGIPRLTPDYPAIDVANEIFGSGGFQSWLMKRIRTELGLAYGLYGAIIPGVVQGKNVIVLQTKAESAGSALEESIRELLRLKRDGPTEDELTQTQRALANSFVFRFDSPGEIASRFASLRMLRYPEDYDRTYLDRIRAVTTEDVRSVAERRWDPGAFVIVVVGNETAYTSIERTLLKLAADPDLKLPKYELQRAKFDQKFVFPGP